MSQHNYSYLHKSVMASKYSSLPLDSFLFFCIAPLFLDYVDGYMYNIDTTEHIEKGR